MSQAPEDLRHRIGSVTPRSYPALDLDDVIRRGRRSVRRRMWGATAASVAVIVAVVVGGLGMGGVLSAHRLTPADPSHVVGYVTWSLPDGVSQGDQPESDYMVSVHSPEGQRQEVDFVHETDAGPRTFARSVIDLSHPLAIWQLAPGGKVVLGLIPSTSVSRLQVDAGEGLGPNISTIPQLGWTAFSFVLGRSGAGPSHFAGLRWSDGQHRPVDAQGRHGTAVQIDAGCWVTVSNDGSDYALDCEGSQWSSFSLTAAPEILYGPLLTNPRIRFGLGVPIGSTHCVVRDSQGGEQNLSTVGLGRYEFGLPVLDLRGGSGHLDSVRCKDRTGAFHLYRLP